MLSFAGLLGLIWMAPSSLAQEPSQPTLIRMGTNVYSNGFEYFGQLLASTIHTNDDELQVEITTNQSNRQSLKLLESGQLDIALIDGAVSRAALEGIGRKPSSVRVLSTLYPGAGLLAVRGNSKYHRVEDLKGQRIGIDSMTSGASLLARELLGGLDLELKRDFDPVAITTPDDGVQQLLDGKLAALWGVGIDWPGFQKIANSEPGIRLVTPSGMQIQQILTRYPHLKKFSIPTGNFLGQQRQVGSLGYWSQILVGPHVPEETVFRLARALHRAHDAMTERFKPARYTTAKVTVTQTPAEHIHLGALRYFNRLGLTQNMCPALPRR